MNFIKTLKTIIAPIAIIAFIFFTCILIYFSQPIKPNIIVESKLFEGDSLLERLTTNKKTEMSDYCTNFNSEVIYQQISDNFCRNRYFIGDLEAKPSNKVGQVLIKFKDNSSKDYKSLIDFCKKELGKLGFRQNDDFDSLIITSDSEIISRYDVICQQKS
jgi:hypothetical protein